MFFVVVSSYLPLWSWIWQLIDPSLIHMFGHFSYNRSKFWYCHASQSCWILKCYISASVATVVILNDWYWGCASNLFLVITVKSRCWPHFSLAVSCVFLALLLNIVNSIYLEFFLDYNVVTWNRMKKIQCIHSSFICITMFFGVTITWWENEV